MSELRKSEKLREAAERAGLRYVTDDQPGYIRKPWGRGFTYRDPEGFCVKDNDLRARFDDLAIPPSWSEVWICLFEDGHMQVTGRDDAGRKQYIYHPEWVRARATQRFSKLKALGKRLPRLRERYDSDLRKHQLNKTRVSAIAVYLLDLTHMRVGRKKYYLENETAGLVTLRDENVEVASGHVEFDFVGKSKKKRNFRVDDRRLAGQLDDLEKHNGRALFTYQYGSNTAELDADDINEYLSESMGDGFSAKDFRSWAGTHIALNYLLDHPPSDETEIPKTILSAVDEAAEHLGNTRAVAREHYIAPKLLQEAERGRLWTHRFGRRTPGLSTEESRTLEWLEIAYAD